MNLLPLTSETVPNGAAIIRIYGDYCTLNAAAMSLLGLVERPCYVAIKRDADYVQRKRIYIGKCGNASGYKVGIRRSGNTGKINSRALCSALSSALQGRGAYRICGECPATVTEFDGKVTEYYEIFFRRYGPR